MALRAPEALGAGHDLDAFDCGEAVLNDWLRRRARANQISGATRTFVLCEGAHVIAYHALSAGAVAIAAAAGRFRRNMPEPIPVAVLARLGVDLRFGRRGIGRAMVADAAHRVAAAAQSIGVRGLLVHALSEPAKDFYLNFGFSPSPLDPMTLMITLADLQAPGIMSQDDPRH